MFLRCSNIVYVHDCCSFDRQQPHSFSRPSKHARSTWMPPGPFGPLGRGADSIIPLHDTQRTQRCRHHPLDDYNKCFNVPKKTQKTHLKLISFYCFFKKVLISLIKEKEEPVFCVGHLFVAWCGVGQKIFLTYQVPVVVILMDDSIWWRNNK